MLKAYFIIDLSNCCILMMNFGLVSCLFILVMGNVFSQELNRKFIYPSDNGYLILNNYISDDFKSVIELLSIPEYELFGFEDSASFSLDGVGEGSFVSRVLHADVNIKDEFVLFKAGQTKRQPPMPDGRDIVYFYKKPCDLQEPNQQYFLYEYHHPVYHKKYDFYSIGSFFEVINQSDLMTINPEEFFVFYHFSHIDKVVSSHINSDNSFLVFLYVNFYFSDFTETIFIVKYFDKFDISTFINWAKEFSSYFSFEEWDYD